MHADRCRAGVVELYDTTKSTQWAELACERAAFGNNAPAYNVRCGCRLDSGGGSPCAAHCRCDEPADDGNWLAAERKPYLDAVEAGGGGLWCEAVAAGLRARYGDLDTPCDINVIPLDITVHRYLTEVIHDMAEPRQWARSLSPDRLDRLVALAAAEVDLLGMALEEIYDTGRWQDWPDACRRRDDLECVLLLLREVGRADDVQPDFLRAVDQTAMEAWFEVPDMKFPRDERLARVADTTVDDCWWAIPERLMGDQQ